MSPRELVILTLGLAIIAVVLRWLVVALRSRRGQIRLAIDKNIPRDVDLNALEMAELPSGGARVVARSLAEVNRQNHVVASASARAAAIDLGKPAARAESIPVLMDPVNLRAKVQRPVRQPVPQVALVATSFSGESEVAESVENLVNLESMKNMESADSVLFDYNEQTDQPRPAVDNLSQVAPDYPGDDEDYDEDDSDDDYDDDDTDEEFEDDVDEELDPEFEDDELDDQEEEEEFDDDELADDDDDDDEYADEDDDDDDEYDPLDEDEEDMDDRELDAGLSYADDELDEFSMTAGERIGVKAEPARPKGQSSLFGEDELAPEPAPVVRRNSLFSAFSRKETPVDTPVTVAKTAAAKPAPAPAVNVAAAKPPIAPKLQESIKPQVMARPQVAAGTHVAPRPQESSRPPASARPQVIAAKPEASRIAPVQQQSKKIKETMPEPTYERAAAEPSEVVVINVMAKSGRMFYGDDLLHVLITSGMKFGDMNIFHRRLSGDNKGPVIFSIANILNPGTFDLNQMQDFSTLGVSLFLALPTSIKNLDAFDQMLTVARQICAALDGELRDDSRNLMTAQTVEHYRQRIRDFELRRLKSVGTRG